MSLLVSNAGKECEQCQPTCHPALNLLYTKNSDHSLRMFHISPLNSSFIAHPQPSLGIRCNTRDGVFWSMLLIVSVPTKQKLVSLRGVSVVVIKNMII
jgi:hypothetical protein